MRLGSWTNSVWSWQIVPARLPELLKDSRARQEAMMKEKLDIAELERASQKLMCKSILKARNLNKTGFAIEVMRLLGAVSHEDSV